MGVPEHKLRRHAWALVWEAVREEAPEVLEDLKGLLPLYGEARPALSRFAVWDWKSLERAAHYAHLAGPSGQALLRLREALLAWAGRWGLSGPVEPLDAGLQALALWAVDPGLPFGFARVGPLVDKAGPVLAIPPLTPRWRAGAILRPGPGGGLRRG